MLVLSRGPSEKICFPNLGISVEVLRIQGNRVRLGVDAPQSVRVLRQEVAHNVQTGLSELGSAFDADRLNHETRNRLHTAQLALKLLERQIQAGLQGDSLVTLQKALREFDALDTEICGKQILETTHSPRALLVEDNQNEVELLSGYLKLFGYEVDSADNGLKALIYLSRHTPLDVVLVDMNLPEMDGAETVRAIRSNPDLNQVKIFAVTGRSQEECGLPLGSKGVDRWFQKPVNPEVLVREIQHDLSLLNTCV